MTEIRATQPKAKEDPARRSHQKLEEAGRSLPRGAESARPHRLTSPQSGERSFCCSEPPVCGTASEQGVP